MSLDHGGHLTHGMKLNFLGQDYQIATYGVDRDTELLNYDEVLEIAKRFKPDLIVAVTSAYSWIIDFKKFREIADQVGAKLLVDMAHIAGLVCTGLHPSPAAYADIITSTTHKTLRGPRGGIILTNDEKLASKINKVIFPGIQGGSLMHVIAGKAIAFKKAASESFKRYQQQVIKNARVLAEELKLRGFRIVSGGMDTHPFCVDVKHSWGLTGKDAEKILDSINIACNKNTIPNDSEKPFITSGIRLKTPAVTTRGFKELEMKWVAYFIAEALKNYQDIQKLKSLKQEVLQLLSKFPLKY